MGDLTCCAALLLAVTTQTTPTSWCLVAERCLPIRCNLCDQLPIMRRDFGFLCYTKQEESALNAKARLPVPRLPTTEP